MLGFLKSPWFTCFTTLAVLLALVSLCPGQARRIDGPIETRTNDLSQRPESGQLTVQQQKDLKLLFDVLMDVRIDDTKRRDAASGLLARQWPQANEALKAAMDSAADPSTARLIAQAVAAAGDPPMELVEPLFGLLAHEQQPLRESAAAALGRYEDRAVLNRLIALSRDDKAEQPQRMAAIEALAEQYQAKAVGALVELTEPNYPQPIREHAMVKLARVTGISDFGYDGAAWQKWYGQVKNKPPQTWLSGMIQTLSRRKAELETDRQRLMEKTTQTYNRLYRATEAKQRPQLLIEMLSDAYAPIRQLGMQIVERELINAQPITPEVRTVIREHLIDTDPTVRAASAKVLRDMADEEAVKQVVGLLLAEQDPAARNAYLLLLARMPRADAVEPALELAEKQFANGAASSFLAAAYEAKLLDANQQTRALGFARRLVTEGNGKPNVAAVKLMGLLAQEQDKQTLIGLLKNGEPAVRQAAADPFVNKRFDPSPLFEYFGDTVLGVKAIEAAAAHGQTVEMIATLLKYEPDTPELLGPWTGAVVAICKRLNLSDVAKVDAMLAGQEQHMALRRSVLASKLPAEDQAIESAELATLMINLSELYMADGLADKVKPLLDRVAAVKDLPADTVGRFNKLRVAAYLATDDLDGALTLAGQWLTGQAQARPVVAVLLLDAIEKRLAAKKTDQAASLIARLQQLVGPMPDQALAERFEKARQQLEKMQSPTEPPATVERPGPATDGG